MEINDDNIVLRSPSVRLLVNNFAKPGEAGVCKPRYADNLNMLTNSALITNLQLKELQSGVNTQPAQYDINFVKADLTLDFTHLDTRQKTKYRQDG